MRSWSWLLSVALVVVACGGKSDILPADTGGAAGTSTGGVGGSSAGGGGAGGSSFGGGGAGGSSFGGGGFGGGGFGGGGSGGQPGFVEQLCAKLQNECPVPNCIDEINQGMKSSAQIGCLQEYQDLMICALKTPVSCSPQGDPQLSPQCDPLLQAFADCTGSSPTCSSYGGPGQCGIDCGVWGASCNIVPGGLHCTCTMGPKGGQSLNIPNQGCNGNWSQIAESFCAP